MKQRMSASPNRVTIDGSRQLTLYQPRDKLREAEHAVKTHFAGEIEGGNGWDSDRKPILM
jgi:hypothetical protein